MEFGLNEDQKMMRDTAREFAEARIKPIEMEIDETEEWPKALIKVRWRNWDFWG